MVAIREKSQRCTVGWVHSRAHVGGGGGGLQSYKDMIQLSLVKGVLDVFVTEPLVCVFACWQIESGALLSFHLSELFIFNVPSCGFSLKTPIMILSKLLN